MNCLWQRKLVFVLSLLSLTFSYAFGSERLVNTSGEYIVELKESTDRLSALQFENVFTVVKVIGKRHLLVKADGPLNPHFLPTQLMKNNLIKRVEPNTTFKLLTSYVPNDPMYQEQWYLDKINAADAWDISKGNREVVVAIIDTGINLNHPELAKNIWVNKKEFSGVKGVDDDQNGLIDDINGFNFIGQNNWIMDDHGHGTYTAGIVGAHTDNAQGLAGINWEVSLMPIKTLNSFGAGSLADAIQALEYAIQMSADIVHMGFGGGQYSQIMHDLLLEGEKRGIIFVVPSGMDGMDLDISCNTYPACYKVNNLITVTATNKNDKLLSRANYGKYSVHVAAPGEQILSIGSNSYSAWSGIVGATSIVTGILALIKSEHPEINALAIKEKLILGSTQNRDLTDKVQSSGVVNAYDSLKY